MGRTIRMRVRVVTRTRVITVALNSIALQFDHLLEFPPALRRSSVARVVEDDDGAAPPLARSPWPRSTSIPSSAESDPESDPQPGRSSTAVGVAVAVLLDVDRLPFAAAGLSMLILARSGTYPLRMSALVCCAGFERGSER